MEIEFRKITNKPKLIHAVFSDMQNSEFHENDSMELEGEVIRQDAKIVKFHGKMKGFLHLVCAISGEEFIRQIDEELVLYFSDGIWETQNQSKNIDSLDVIEFFDGYIDFDFILASEIESIRLDYNVKE